jgi:hypothetical protein
MVGKKSLNLLVKQKLNNLILGFIEFFLIGFKNENRNFVCALKCKSNKFNNLNNKNYWDGKYSCLEPGCCLKFDANLSKSNFKSDKFIINVSWTGVATHPITLVKKNRCTGEKRKTLALNIMSEGVANIQAKNIINFYDTTNKSMYNK